MKKNDKPVKQWSFKRVIEETGHAFGDTREEARNYLAHKGSLGGSTRIIKETLKPEPNSSETDQPE